MLIDKFLDFIKKEKPSYSPKVILDVGSRDLGQSLEFRSVYPDALILAFEPNPHQKAEIESKLTTNIKFFPVALGSSEGTAILHSPPQNQNHGAGSLLKPHYSAIVQDYNEYPVPVRRLDSILKELGITKVDILWADAQGFEIEVMIGMGDYLSTVDFIHTEATMVPYYEGHPVKSVVEEFLKENDFLVKEFSTPNFHPYGEGDLFVVNKSLAYG